jgi:hypothetical protein
LAEHIEITNSVITHFAALYDINFKKVIIDLISDKEDGRNKGEYTLPTAANTSSIIIKSRTRLILLEDKPFH